MNKYKENVKKKRKDEVIDVNNLIIITFNFSFIFI